MTGLRDRSAASLAEAVGPLLRHCAAAIAGKVPRLKTGSWTLTFETSEKAVFDVYCDIVDGEVREERITRNDEILLNRRGESGEIKNDHTHEMRPTNLLGTN